MSREIICLNEQLDLLSHNDRQGLNTVFRQFSVFITASLDNLKGESKQDFNEVMERLLRYLHHHCGSSQDEQEGDDMGEGSRQLFFSSCLAHLLIFTTPTRRLLAQTLRDCSLYPSSSVGFLPAFLSLLDAHHQKVTFDVLKEFLHLWILGHQAEGTEMVTMAGGSKKTGEIVIGNYTTLAVCTTYQHLPGPCYLSMSVS